MLHSQQLCALSFFFITECLNIWTSHQLHCIMFRSYMYEWFITACAVALQKKNIIQPILLSCSPCSLYPISQPLKPQRHHTSSTPQSILHTTTIWSKIQDTKKESRGLVLYAKAELNNLPLGK